MKHILLRKKEKNISCFSLKGGKLSLTCEISTALSTLNGLMWILLNGGKRMSLMEELLLIWKQGMKNLVWF